MTDVTLAVDAGQTEVRAALYPIDREGGPRTGVGPGVRRMDSAAVGPDTVAGAVLDAVDDLGPLDGPPGGIGLGLSGFEIAADAELAADRRAPARARRRGAGGHRHRRRHLPPRRARRRARRGRGGGHRNRGHGLGRPALGQGGRHRVGAWRRRQRLRHRAGRPGQRTAPARRPRRFGGAGRGRAGALRPAGPAPAPHQPGRSTHPRRRGVRPGRGARGRRGRPCRAARSWPARAASWRCRGAPPSTASSSPARAQRFRAPATSSVPGPR